MTVKRRTWLALTSAMIVAGLSVGAFAYTMLAPHTSLTHAAPVQVQTLKSVRLEVPDAPPVIAPLVVDAIELPAEQPKKDEGPDPAEPPKKDEVDPAQSNAGGGAGGGGELRADAPDALVHQAVVQEVREFKKRQDRADRLLRTLRAQNDGLTTLRPVLPREDP